MPLSDYVNTLGQVMLKDYGQRVHKIAINAGFTCPNRDGTKGTGGCTFCNNASFNPNAHTPDPVADQVANARQVIAKRTRAVKFIAYFQAYTNTYAEVQQLDKLYRQALAETDVVGLSVGTRPDSVPEPVLELLAGYQDEGYDVWLELGLQSSHQQTLDRVNRGHDLDDYLDAMRRAAKHNLRVCTHLIFGLPGEQRQQWVESALATVAAGTTGLKLHPLHVVKGTALANNWRQGEHPPLAMQEYIEAVVDVLEQVPEDMIFHRLTGTAQHNLLLAPDWCSKKWIVLNGIEAEIRQRNSYQGRLAAPRVPVAAGA